MDTQDEYFDFVEHPRYGRSPRFTDLRPSAVPLGYQLTRYQSHGLIPGTAVAADLKQQSYSPVGVLYYFDLQRVCVDCQRSFIFFAEEQKYWYETLGFDMASECVRCVDCRKLSQNLERQRQRYEELMHCENRSIEEHLEMAECCLDLMEAGVFGKRQTERVRMLMNRIVQDRDQAVEQRCHEMRRRVARLEA